MSRRAEPVEPAAVIAGHGIDEQGNPLVRLNGCPNCGTGAGWADPLQFFGFKNAGRDPDGPCSRACELQADYAAELEARRC